MKKILIFAICLLPSLTFAQNWLTAGNALTSGSYLGSSNAQALIFKTNALERASFSSTGVFKVNSLGGTGNGLIQVSSDGTTSRLSLPGTSTQVLTGAGTFTGIGSIAGWGVPSTGITSTTNKVGIGISSPTNALEVNGSGVFTGTVFAEQFVVSDIANVQGRLSLTSNVILDGYDPAAGTRNEVFTTSQPYYIQSSPFYNMNTILNHGNGGNVGIGTNTPAVKFHVVGDSRFDGDVSFSQISLGTGSQIKWTPGSPNILQVGPSDITPSLPACYFPTIPTINAFYGVLHSYGPSAFGGAINSMTMGFDGANGVIDVAGTSTDGTAPRLLVNYYCGKDVLICTGSSGGVVSVGHNFEAGFPTRDLNVVTNIMGDNKTGLEVTTNGSGETQYNTLLNVNSNTAKSFFIHNSAASGGIGQDVFQVFGNGNTFIGGKVGIGTTCIPDGYTVGVKGYIICEGVNVKLSDASGCWPDYVFNNEYNLMKLPELENYIKSNKHLPNVPSAKDVEQNGLSLEKNNQVLLEKVEELTLYIIELQKQVDELKSKVK